jgi:pantoate--beta-alanine ligase
MSLVEAALEECDQVIVSIFVNPLQFGQGEDFNRYPRPFEKDMEFCREAGVHAVFHPGVDQMYPQGQEGLTRVVVPRHLIRHLCGAFRPGHFEGVATVVCKLFGMVQPHRAYFGEKDYQQLVVIRQMVTDLNLPVTIVPVPTYREPDGLAMSSRNVYLDQDQRRLAPELHKVLCFVEDKAGSGKMSLFEALAAGREMVAGLPGVTLQYLEACDPVSLEPLVSAGRPMVILAAAKFGDIRLIDNVIVR